MGLMDRDYMRQRRTTAPENAIVRWWRRSSMTEVLGTGVLAIGLLSSAVWLARDFGISAESSEATLRVNVNTATLDELETLPGIGPALAQLVVASRPYESIDELIRVKGIGPATVESLRPFVKVSGDTETIRD